MPMRIAVPLALLLALPALPAAANSSSHQGGSPNHHFAVRHNAARQQVLVQQFRLTRLPEVVRFHQLAFDNVFRPGFFGGRGFFGGTGFGGGGFFGGTGWDIGGYPSYPAGFNAPAQVIAMAPPLPQRRLGDDRATVETTASGVTIIRGPGSHHR